MKKENILFASLVMFLALCLLFCAGYVISYLFEIQLTMKEGADAQWYHAVIYRLIIGISLLGVFVGINALLTFFVFLMKYEGDNG